MASRDSDLILDRARLERRLLVWRVLAVLALLGCSLALSARHGLGGPHVAELSLQGVIGDDPALAERVAAVAEDRSAKALLIAIDSPGGSAAGGVALHDAIARVARHKPVVAVMGGLAASAGYMVALPAQRIIASPATLTGSIGVLLETPDLSTLLGRVGVAETRILSGPLKGQPSLYAPLTPAGRDYLQGLVDDMFDQFVTMVADGRHMPKAKILPLADGRAYTGRQALALGLIDQLGGLADARSWLARQGVARTLPLRDLSRSGRWPVARLRGQMPGLLEAVANFVFPQRVTLDGLLALWQP